MGKTGSYTYAIADKKLLKECEGDDLTAMTHLGDKNQLAVLHGWHFLFINQKKGGYNYEI